VKIHPSAIVSPAAILAEDVEIGPFCIVERGVQIGNGCRLVAHATIRTGTTLGSETTVYEGAVLGGLPQLVSPPADLGGVVIGSRNVIREHTTVHRAMHQGANTEIGDDCLLMVGAHVAHDCQLGNNVILSNGTLLGGHVKIGDRACLGGGSAVHQFCRIGRIAMIGACTKITKDIPPFMLADGATALIVGLNKVGLRRADFSREEILSLKAAYRMIYREGFSFRETIAALQEHFPTGVASEYATFFRGDASQGDASQGGQRGFTQERRSPPRVALRIHPPIDDISDDISDDNNNDDQAPSVQATTPDTQAPKAA